MMILIIIIILILITPSKNLNRRIFILVFQLQPLYCRFCPVVFFPAISLLPFLYRRSFIAFSVSPSLYRPSLCSPVTNVTNYRSLAI